MKLLRIFCLLKRLLNEKSEYEQTGSSVVLHAFERSLFAYNQDYENETIVNKGLSNICDNYIDIARKKMIKGMNLVPQMNDSLIQRFIHMNTPTPI